MSISERFSKVCLSAYKHINHAGILNNKWGQSIFVASYFAYKKYFEDPNAKLIKNYPELVTGGHILDIGANIGYTAYIFSQVVHAPYKVFAFEPEEKNLFLFKKVVKQRSLLEKVVIVPAAVGDKDGEIEIWQNAGHHADHRVLTEQFKKQLTGAIQVQKTPLITIDNFLHENAALTAVKFIKIDVQGYELAVCKGMEKTLAANPDCVIALEYCPSIMTELGYHAHELLQFLQNKNFFFYKLNKQGHLIPLDITTDANIQLGNRYPGYFDIVCMRNRLK